MLGRIAKALAVIAFAFALIIPVWNFTIGDDGNLVDRSLMGQDVDVYVFDVSKEPYPVRILATTLQGVVNKQANKGNIFLIFTDDDWFWIDYYHERFNISYMVVDDVFQLLNLTKYYVTGYVVYDPRVAYSTDIATTIAGLNGSIVISPDMINDVEQIGVGLDMDLRGKFAGMSKVEIYQWEYQFLWPLCNHTLIGNTYTPPHWITVNLTSYLQSSGTIYIKFEDAFPEDGFGSELYYMEIRVESTNVSYIVPDTPAEALIMYDSDGSWIDRDGHRIADENQYWIYRLNIGKDVNAELIMEIYQQYKVSISTNPSGPWEVVASCPTKIYTSGTVPQIIDYLVSRRSAVISLSSTIPDEYELKNKFFSEMEHLGIVLGWHCVNGSEKAHVRQASENGLIVLCSMESPNFSFHCKIRPSVPIRQHLPQISDVEVENKTYVTFFHSDGDALWCVSRRFVGAWDSPVRGKIPLGWEIQPLLLELAPGMLLYYFENASSSDEFIASCSGLGYIYPDAFPSQLLPQYLQMTNKYLQKLNFRNVFVYPISSASTALMDSYSNYVNFSRGFFEGYFPRTGPPKLLKQSVWVKTRYHIEYASQTAEKIAQDLETIAEQSNGKPSFISVHVLRSFPDVNERIYNAVSLLNKSEFKVVGPYEFSLILLKCLRINEAVNFLLNQFNETVGLCREAPQAAPNTYWLVSDNLFAFKALERYNITVANAIKSKLRELAQAYNLPTDDFGLPRSFKHEAVLGDVVPVPFNLSVPYTLVSNSYEIKTEIANSTVRMTDWREYADLLLFASLSYHFQGNDTKAIELFNEAKQMWNFTSLGIYDKAAKVDGKYATYKLALLLYVSKILEQPLEFEEQLISKMWSLQDPDTGGIITNYYFNGTPCGDVNTETTSLVVLASSTYKASISITELYIFPSEPKVGEAVTIYITIFNNGNHTETFDLSLSYMRISDPLIGIYTITLAPGEAKTLNITWTPEMGGRYEIKAYLGLIPNDINFADNAKSVRIYVHRQTTSYGGYSKNLNLLK